MQYFNIQLTTVWQLFTFQGCQIKESLPRDKSEIASGEGRLELLCIKVRREQQVHVTILAVIHSKQSLGAAIKHISISDA